MSYPELPNYQKKLDMTIEYLRLKHEYGNTETQKLANKLELVLENIYNEAKNLAIDEEAALKEPDDLDAIKALRPSGPRKLDLNSETLMDKLEGAFTARMAGCTLGAPVEFYTVESMEKWAAYNGDNFPPTDYWTRVKNPGDLRYNFSDCVDYTKGGMKSVPVDDDITYTILGLLIAEEHGVNFTVRDVGDTWLKYLPYACTAEEVALNNLKAGIDPMKAADVDNPYCQWIGADIRSDPFAYMAPAYPEKAAELAYRDAYLSHRRNGIYGEMFFAAAQSAAFAVDSARAALEIGLTEIPESCALAKDVRWALDIADTIQDYKQARQIVDERFAGMSGVHTNNNACLTIFSLIIGGNDMTKVISEAVAMGLDNDCTAATAGSIVGAIIGKSNIPENWYKNFNNTVDTYLLGTEPYKIDDLMNRFAKLAEETRRS